MTRSVRHLPLAVLLGCLMLAVALTCPRVLAQQRVGINSAVNPAAMGIPPGGLPRRLVLGQDVVFNERITTEAAGQTQILFVDESTLSVGPNANMVIDQFVYDPNAGTGKLVASLGRGVFRFVGGKLSKQDNAVTMRTPTATIGIRGGVMLIDQAANGRLEVIFVYGKGATITGLNGVSQSIYRPGFAVSVSGPGASPSEPGPAPPGQTAALLAQLDGRAGSNGGAPAVPTEVSVASSGIANVISANLAASIQSAAKTQPTASQSPNAGQTVQQTVPPTTLQIAANPQGASTASTAFATPILAVAAPVISTPTPPVVTVPVVTPPVVTPPVITPPVIPPPPVVPPVTPPVNIASVAGGFADTGSQGIALGFVGPVSPYSGASVVNGEFVAPGLFSFPLSAGTAAITSGTGTTSPLGPVTGATYVSPDNTFFFADLVPVNQPTQREFVYGGTPVSQAFYQATSSTPTYLAFAVVPDGALTSAIPFIRQQAGGSLSSPSVSPLILATPPNTTFSTTSGATKALQASFAVNGSGAQQSSVLVVLVGNVFGNASGAPGNLAGVIHGSYLANGTSQPVRINSYYQPPLDGKSNSFYGGNSISGFVLAPGAGANNAVEVNTSNQTTAANYQFAQPVIPTAVPAAANGPQTTRGLTGYFGGVMTKEPVGGSGSPLAYPVAGTTSISTNASNLQLAATLTGGDPFTSRTSGIPTANGIVLQYGTTQTGATNARQAFISDNLFAALESPTASSTVNGVTVSFNNSFPNTNPNIYLATQTAAPPPASLLPNGLCNSCQFLQWGYWGGEIDTPASGNNPARVDVGHVNFWVAGTPATSVADISSLKAANFTGTYNGNLIGTVVNSGAQYLASGGLQATYNFGTQAGSFTVSKYDVLPTTTFSGKAPLNGSSYMFASTKNGIAVNVNGSFYGSMAAETGGNFALTAGPRYFSSGVFAAKR